MIDKGKCRTTVFCDDLEAWDVGVGETLAREGIYVYL